MQCWRAGMDSSNMVYTAHDTNVHIVEGKFVSLGVLVTRC